MLSRTIAYLSGILLLYQFPVLPDPLHLLWPMALAMALYFHPATRRYFLIPLCFAVGLAWAGIDAWQRLHPAMSSEYEGINLDIHGVVDSLPEYGQQRLRFVFLVESARIADGSRVILPSYVRLAWYDGYPKEITPGEHWQLRVRLKRPWSFSNPGGFDYEAWLFQQGIGATGYVRKGEFNQRLPQPVSGYALNRLRYELSQRIAQALPDYALAGIITALAIGERSGISDMQWDVLLATGTNHLVAISGLHIGLVAGLVFLLMRRLWRWSPRCCLLLPAPQAAAIGAMLAATAYAALAGFSIPTQRALVMLAVVLAALLWRRPIERGRVLLLALLAVCTFDPVAVLSAGFWLSFAAVGWILYGMGGRLAATGWWWRWGRVQWLVAAGLLPLLFLFFQQDSLVAPLANLFAVPWVSLLVVPLTLVGVMLLPLWPALASMLLALAATLMQWLWPLLQWLSETVPVLPLAVSWWTMLLAILGLLWLFAPRGWPLRSLGFILLLPLLFPHTDRPEQGVARLTLLDVGQGLAAVVQTRDHTLLFDTGPAFPSGFNTGKAVVVPYLRAAGIRHIDTLILSHDGNDHAGGAEAVLEQFTPEQILLGGGSTLKTQVAVMPCRRGMAWNWDGVRFRILHPGEQGRLAKKNNRSCVLRVTVGKESLLLTGDIEQTAERQLLASGKKLQAEVLVAPHHGSRTSSSTTFVDAVRPRWVLFSVGYRNRYGFPAPRIVERYQQLGAEILRTDAQGAIGIELGRGSPGPYLLHRQQHRRLWHVNM